jgi:hypothetical protein
MARYKLKYTVQVTDINGDVANVDVTSSIGDTVTVAGLATIMAGIVSPIAAATNGKVTRQSVTILFNQAQYLVGTTPPNNAEYSSVTDGARFQFADGAGERTSITIPAPLEAMFGSNSNVIDSTQTQAAGVITMMEANAGDLAGTLFNLYKGGAKVGRGVRRRRSLLVP